MSKLFRNLFSKAVKISFDVEVHSVILPHSPQMSGKIANGDMMAVQFERGSHSIFSGDSPAEVRRNGDVSCEFEETLTLEATLYQDSAGEYREKEGKVELLQRKAGILGLKKGRDAFKSIGVVSLQLQALADGQPHDVTVPLQWCIAEGAEIKLTISSRAAGEGKNSSSSPAAPRLTADSLHTHAKGKNGSDFDEEEEEAEDEHDEEDDDHHGKKNEEEEEEDDNNNPFGKGDFDEDVEEVSPTRAHHMTEIFALNYQQGMPVKKFKCTLPPNAVPGKVIKNIAGKENVSVRVPEGCFAGDEVILVLPDEDVSHPPPPPIAPPPSSGGGGFDAFSDFIDEEEETNPWGEPPTAPSFPAPALPGATVAEFTPTTHAGEDTKALQAALSKLEQELENERRTSAAFKEAKEKAEKDLKKASVASTGVAATAMNQLGASAEEVRSLKDQVANLTEELSAHVAKDEYLTSEVSRLNDTVAMLTAERANDAELKTRLEGHAKQLEEDNEALHKQILDDKVKVLAMHTEVEEANKKAATFKAKVQTYASRIASMEVALAEAQLGHEESKSGPAPASAPSAPSFMKKPPAAAAAPVPAASSSAPVKTTEERITEIYTLHNPAKLPDIPRILEKYKGSEVELLAKLEQQYGKQ